MKGWKRWGASAMLSVALWTGANAAATTSVEMLREMFSRPITEWQQTLRSNTRLLNEEFFTNVGKRVRWGIENNHVDDALRFAIVGDFAAEAVGKPANYRIDLADLFFKAQNYNMAGQIVDNILVSSGNTPAAKPARFMKAKLYEVNKDLFNAYNLYVELANDRFRPEETWYSAGLISLFMNEVSRAKEELGKSAQAGSTLAPQRLEEIAARENQSWDSIPAARSGMNQPTVLPNTKDVTPYPASSENPEYPDLIPAGTRTDPATPSNSGVALTTPQPAGDPLEQARMAVADNRLIDAIDLFEGIFDPGNAEVSVEFGAVLYRMGDLEQAKGVYDKALARNAKNVELLRGRANTLERMYDRQGQKTDLNAALADYRQARTLDPQHMLLPWELTRAESKV